MVLLGRLTFINVGLSLMAVYYPTPVDPIYNSHYHGGYFPTQAEYATSYGHPPVQYIPSHYSQGYAVPQVMTPQVVMVCALPILETSFPSYTLLEATELCWQRPL